MDAARLVVAAVGWDDGRVGRVPSALVTDPLPWPSPVEGEGVVCGVAGESEAEPPGTEAEPSDAVAEPEAEPSDAVAASSLARRWASMR